MIALQEVVRRLEDIKSVNEVPFLLTEIATEIRAANIAYMVEDVSTPEENPIRYVTYSREWEERYFDRGYLGIDPVADGINKRLPFDWQAVARTASLRWLFAEAESFGVGRQGVSVPIRGASGERALITLTSFQSNREWETKRWRYQALVSAFAPYLHEFALLLHDHAQKQVRLSHRQRQCLQLYARGYAPKQIAAHLEISSSMTREHLHCARRKLGALTLSSAVFRASRLNLVNV
ncbi:helix-turn-helix transcriptional regulator [Xanthobacter pseudotagetidis]|uniref:helix-turn-helix transcriptional regulator n=1 Tax=Xanthobacter pseudotagetidis TaxID=3119911 RepID=UPI00372B8F7A